MASLPLASGLVAAYMVDGPFDPAKKPWLLSNQRRMGIEQQPTVTKFVYGVEVSYFERLHGPTRGAKGHVSEVMNQEAEIPIVGIFNLADRYERRDARRGGGTDGD